MLHQPAGFGSFLMLSVPVYAGALRLLAPDFYYSSVQEDEYLEWATFWSFALAAGCFVFAAAQRRGERIWPWFPLGLAAFCGVVAMEEISWGQRLLAEAGDDAPVAWLGRGARYNEKLATPDVSIADLLGDIETVAVKEGYGRFSARVLSPEETHPRIRAAAERGLKAGGRPWQLETPLHVAVDFLRSAEADMAEIVPGSQRTGGRTVEYSHETPEMAFKALQAIVTLGGVAANRWAQALYSTGARIA